MHSSPRPSRPAALVLLVLLALASNATLFAQQQSGSQDDPPVKEPSDASSQDAIVHGVAAFKEARFPAALLHFKKALALDPKSTQARLYLGVTYSNQVVPGLDTPENLATAKLALDNFQLVPEGAPEYLSALRHIAFLYHNIKRFDEAKQTELKILKLQPGDAQAHFTIGVIDWRQAYQNAVQALTTQNLTDDGTGNATLASAACLDLSKQNTDLVKDGIDHLTRATELKPGYEDAMQYLNLTYRRQADFACGDDARRTASVAQAEAWTHRAALIPRPAAPAASPAAQ